MTPSLDFAALPYAEVKTALFARLPPESATQQQCLDALAAIDVLQVLRPAETEHEGARLTTRGLEAMRQKFEKRLAVLGWNARRVETLAPTDDLQ